MKIHLTANGSFSPTYSVLRQLLLAKAEAGEVVDTGHWQALSGVPHQRTFELMDVALDIPISRTPGSWASFMLPNMPWAEDHFQERIGGKPLNPGEQYKKWPWYAGGVEDHKSTGQFSHTYMERFWPRYAEQPADALDTDELLDREGIRFRYGDLADLINLLWKFPFTRQAYLPIWFPEDLAAARAGERVPCTLGYHFMLRNNRLTCTYPIRSCDFVRYLKDDAYMAGRLTQWIIGQLAGMELEKYQTAREDDRFLDNGLWTHDVQPGTLCMVIPSLHCFEGDIPKLQREQTEYQKNVVS